MPCIWANFNDVFEGPLFRLSRIAKRSGGDNVKKVLWSEIEIHQMQSSQAVQMVLSKFIYFSKINKVAG